MSIPVWWEPSSRTRTTHPMIFDDTAMDEETALQDVRSAMEPTGSLPSVPRYSKKAPAFCSRKEWHANTVPMPHQATTIHPTLAVRRRAGRDKRPEEQHANTAIKSKRIRQRTCTRPPSSWSGCCIILRRTCSACPRLALSIPMYASSTLTQSGASAADILSPLMYRNAREEAVTRRGRCSLFFSLCRAWTALFVCTSRML